MRCCVGRSSPGRCAPGRSRSRSPPTARLPAGPRRADPVGPARRRAICEQPGRGRPRTADQQSIREHSLTLSRDGIRQQCPPTARSGTAPRASSGGAAPCSPPRLFRADRGPGVAYWQECSAGHGGTACSCRQPIPPRRRAPPVDLAATPPPDQSCPGMYQVAVAGLCLYRRRSANAASPGPPNPRGTGGWPPRDRRGPRRRSAGRQAQRPPDRGARMRRSRCGSAVGASGGL